jgi:hypothetical protein
MVISSGDRFPEALQCLVARRAASRCGSTNISYGSSNGGMLLAKETLVMHHQPCRRVSTCLGVLRAEYALVKLHAVAVAACWVTSVS